MSNAPKTQKKMGLFTTITVGVGLVLGSSVFLAIGQGTSLGGPWYTVSLGIAALIFVAICLCYAELHDMMPGAEGGLGQYTLVAFGPATSIAANVGGYCIYPSIICAVELLMCAKCVNLLFLPNVPSLVICIAFYVVLGGVNLLGVDIFAAFQKVLVAVLMITLVGMGVVGALGIAPNADALTIPAQTPELFGASGVVALMSSAIYMFYSIEYIVACARDMKNPKRDVRLAMIFSCIILWAVYSLVSIGLYRYLDLNTLSVEELPNVLFATTLFGPFGRFWMGIATIFAGASSVNTIMRAVPNIFFKMGQDKMMPKAFSKTNRYNAPSFAILFTMILMIAMCILTNYINLPTAQSVATIFAIFLYALIALAVLVLRKRYPHANRNKKWMLLSIPQLLAVVSIIYMMLHVTTDAQVAMRIGLAFLIVAAICLACAIIWCVKVMHVKPFHAASIDAYTAEPDYLIEAKKEETRRSAVPQSEA